MTRLAGVTGTLFPTHFLAEAIPAAADLQNRQRFLRWWEGVERLCGPASGLRALFDLVVVPLFDALGFRAEGVNVERTQAQAVLRTPGGARVALVLLPWAGTGRAIWRDALRAACDARAAWCFVVSPPLVSLVDARGSATRRAMDFRLPDVLGGGFAVFKTLASASAFDTSQTPSEGTALEGLLAAAATFQARVREDLQEGVADALAALESVLASGRRDESLVLVYRILFLMFAESRDLLPRTHPVYGQSYSVGSLCRTALGGGRGLWEGLAAITRLARAGCRADELIVYPFNGALFARETAPALEQRRSARPLGRHTRARDEAMARALVALGYRRGGAGHEEISYADLGVEQLGAVYERVLAPGVRKETGTFYTPQALAEFVVRRALWPLVSGATPDAILALRVLDPAMGSGAFLVAACRYLAAAYERALIEDGRASPADVDEDARAAFRRLIAERCLFGVDRNPTATQLARLSLWLTTLAAGRPLTFLDHRLRSGNSLVGTTPDDLWRSRAPRKVVGRPDMSLFGTQTWEESVGAIVRPLIDMCSRPDDSVQAVRAKESTWRHLVGEQSPVHTWRMACDLWCAQWFGPRGSEASGAETRAAIDAIIRQDRTLPAGHLARLLHRAAEARQGEGFFHWPLEFPDVFHDEHGSRLSNPGFDAIIGNPPWEMVRHDAQRATDAGARTGSGSQLVRFVRESGAYDACDRGHVNLYQPFVERSLALTRRGGRIGLVLPWSFATDEGTAALRRRILAGCRQQTIVGLDNARGLFPIHRGLRFLATTFTHGPGTEEIRGRFGVMTAEEIEGLPAYEDGSEPTRYPVRLTAAAIARTGGGTGRIADIRRPEDLVLVERLTSAFPALGSASGWGVRFGRELNATEDRRHFGTRGLTVIEGKHLDRFTVHANDSSVRLPAARARALLPDARYRRPRLGYRDVSGVGNRWSLIAAVIPARVVTTHTIFCLRSRHSRDEMDLLAALFNSYVLNAIVRMWMGSHVTTSLVESLPVPRRRGSAIERRIIRLSQRLRTGRANAHTEAALQGAVARFYELDVGTFRSVLTAFPRVPAEDRERAATALAGLWC